MKKIYLFLLVLVAVFVACKKDMDVEFSTFEVEDETIIPSYTSTDLTCKVRCVATINEFYLQYDTVADFATYQEVQLEMNEKTEVYSVKIGELLDNTRYYVRYVAVNSYSQVTSEEVSEFKTLQATTPTIEVREITDVLDTIAIVGFVLKFNGGAEVTKMGVCWSVDSVPTIEDKYVECSRDAINCVSDGDSLVLKISGLEANTTYYVRAYAENMKGVGYSESKAFVTLTLPEVETEDVTDIQLTSGWLNGLVLFNGNDTTTEYGFCWGEEADLTIEESQNVKVEVAEDSTFTYRLSNLKDEMKYYVRAYAKNKIGLVYGDVKEFTTQSTILAVVVTAEALDVTYTSAKVGGKVEADGGSDVTERGICYSTTKSPTIENKKVVLGSGLGSFTTEISDLQDGTKYYVRAYAINKKGVSYGETVVFETKVYLLADVITSLPTTISYTSAVVGGTVVSDGGVEVVERGVCYSTTENSTIANSKIVVDKGIGSFSTTLLGLLEGTKYYVRAYAINKKGVSYGDEVTFETLSRFVDLGLSVKWATCNVGAELPEAGGGYFAWGETAVKDSYVEENYKFLGGSGGVTKYNDKDYKVILDLEDDAAHVNWGGEWRMPTIEEFQELLDNCTWTLVSAEYEYGVPGYKVTSNIDGYRDKSIFLPMPGYMSPSGWSDNTYYQSSSLPRGGGHARNMVFDVNHYPQPRPYILYYHYGCPIRPVLGEYSYPPNIRKYKILVSSIDDAYGYASGAGIYVEGEEVELSARANEGYEFVRWDDGITENPRKIVVTQNATYIAIFEKAKTYQDGHEYVDLGLPSGLKWATCNVGATIPEEYGDYFAWGEIAPKTTYNWSTYKYCAGSSSTMTKYCTQSSSGNNGFTDNKTVLDLEDDAAHVNWGGAWRMPTKAEQDELLNNCTWTWTTQNGVNGYKVTGPNGNSIFLPAAGCMDEGTLRGAGSGGYYWFSSLYADDPYGAYNVYFDSGYVKRFVSDRYYGRSVRPVYGDVSLPKEKYTISVYSNDNSRGTVSGGGTYDEGSQVTITATAKSGYIFKEWNDGNTENPRVITVTKDAIYTAHFETEKNLNAGHEYVDLGLPSGLKWATCNVGANSPEEYGYYFAWGEVELKATYNWDTYKYYDDYNLTKYTSNDSKTVLDPEDDAATVNWGGAWRMPTKAEQDELRNNCIWDWTTQNGVNGCEVTGPNGNSIFLPAAGYVHEGTLNDAGSIGFYWSSSLYAGYPDYAYYVYFDSYYVDWYGDRDFGQSVRPVCQ